MAHFYGGEPCSTIDLKNYLNRRARARVRTKTVILVQISLFDRDETRFLRLLYLHFVAGGFFVPYILWFPL